MEQNPNNPNPQANTQHDHTHELILQAHIIQQGQSINRLYKTLQSSSAARGFNIFLSVLLEILMYLLFIGTIIFVIFISESVESQSADLSEIIFRVKVALFLISFMFLFFAILLRRNRKKNALIARAFAETELMKKNFDETMQLFRF